MNTNNSDLYNYNYMLINRHMNQIDNLINIINNNETFIRNIINQPNNITNIIPNTDNNNNTNNNTNTFSFTNRTNTTNIPTPPPPPPITRLNNFYTSMNNSSIPSNNDIILEFDTVFPNIFSSLLNNINNTDNSTNNNNINYNILNVTTDNSFVLQNIDEISYNILNIEEYSWIENTLNDICPITRDRFYANQNVCMIKNCKHIFNKESLFIWCRNHNCCPTCRTPII